VLRWRDWWRKELRRKSDNTDQRQKCFLHPELRILKLREVMANDIFAVVSFIPNLALNWIFSFELSLDTLDLITGMPQTTPNTTGFPYSQPTTYKSWAHFTEITRRPYLSIYNLLFVVLQCSSPTSSCCMSNVALSHYGHPFKSLALPRGHSGEILMAFSSNIVGSSEMLFHKEIRPLMPSR